VKSPTAILTAVCLAGCAARAPLAEPSSPPLVCPSSHCAWTGLADLVDSAVAAGAAPGVVVAVSVRGVRYIHGSGRLGLEDATVPDPGTIYDLASLTKVVALTTGLIFAVEEGRLSLDAPIRQYLPAFQGPGKDAITLRQLLTHSSGLPAHRRLWEQSPGREGALALVNATPLDTIPGAQMVYSDLGAMVMTEALESVYGTRIDTLMRTRLFLPLDLRSTTYLPPAEWRNRIAPTERDPWRGRVLRGEVHDENASWLGGVSGHAGLFSSAADLLRFGEWFLARRKGPGSAVTREFTRRQNVVPGSSRALGWDTPSPNSSAGTRLSPESFGHTGFTGTSIWMDPSRELVVVLLSNRVHPSRDNPRLGPLRPLVADRAVEILLGSVVH
jgi:CubicO group peptidase (beta-lactamase class C family)